MVKIDEIRNSRVPGKYIPEIYHLDKEARTLLTLLNPDASDHDRYGCAQTLKGYGCSLERTVEIIKSLNKWKNFNESMTVTHLRKVYGYKERSNITAPKQDHSNFGAIGAPCSYSFQLCEDFMKAKKTEPIFFMSDGNNNFPVYSEQDFVMKAAADRYLEMGFHPVPKSDKGKYPSIKWREYSDRKPTFIEMSQWDFSNGVCLVASRETCFLDIDKRGMDNLDIKKRIIELCKTCHYETTPSGGIHIYGKGDLKSVKKFAGEIEIIGYGGLIVAAPTKGYVSLGAFL